MKAAVHHAFGNPADVLTVEERPMPEPGQGEIRVRTILASIHNHDLITVEGDYGYKPAQGARLHRRRDELEEFLRRFCD